MRQRTRRRQLEAAVPRLRPSGHAQDRSMSMTAFFGYLHDHEATTDLAKALADVAMLRTTGARPVRIPSGHQRIAS